MGQIEKKRMSDWEFIKLNLKAFNEMMRWNEVIFLLVTLFIGYLFFGWWGIIGACVLDWLNHLGGGPMIYLGPESEPPKAVPKEKCKIPNCAICEKYKYKSRWWEKII